MLEYGMNRFCATLDCHVLRRWGRRREVTAGGVEAAFPKRAGVLSMSIPGNTVTPVMSIGALARAAGVPASTLRTWERRYGFPEASRGPGGHREYPAELVPHLILLKRALDAGHRPGQIMALRVPQLRALMGLAAATPELSGGVAPSSTSAVVAQLLDATRKVDADAFERILAVSFARHRATDFLQDHLGPFLVALGDAWERGELSVYHEHFVSDLVCAFLTTRCHDAAGSGDRGTAVLAALPHHRHVIGLHMAAVVLVYAGWEPLFLGADTPISDIVRCAMQAGAGAVCVSTAAGAEAAVLAPLLAELREGLPQDVAVLHGGGGAVAVDGVVVVPSLRELEAWALG